MTCTLKAAEGDLFDRFVEFGFDSIEKNLEEFEELFLFKGGEDKFKFFLLVHGLSMGKWIIEY